MMQSQPAPWTMPWTIVLVATGIVGIDAVAAGHTALQWQESQHGGCCEAYLAAGDAVSYVVIPVSAASNNKILRSEDFGHNWQQIFPFAGAPAPPQLGIEGDVQAFRNEVAYFGIKKYPAPGNLFARSDDRGDSWTVVDEPIATGMDQPWLYLGPVQSPQCPAQRYVLAMHPALGNILAFSCDHGDTWTVRTFATAPGINARNVACYRDAVHRIAAGLFPLLAIGLEPWPAEARIMNPEFNYTRSGLLGHWGPDARFYWAEVVPGPGSVLPGFHLLVCRTADLGQTWLGQFVGLPDGFITSAGLTHAHVAFDNTGHLYIHAVNALFVSENNGATFFRKHLLPAWGNDYNNTRSRNPAWFATRDNGFIDIAIRFNGTNPLGSCPDPDGCMGLVRVLPATSPIPNIQLTMVDDSMDKPNGDINRMDFAMIGTQPPPAGSTFPAIHVGYTDATGVITRSRGVVAP